MSTAFLSMFIAMFLVLLLVLSLAIISLLNGGLYFLFSKQKFYFLKTSKGETGFAFGFTWNSAREPGKFNLIRIRLYNPFGKLTQVDILKEFSPKGSDFAVDEALGVGIKNLINADNLENATVTVELSALSDNLSYYFTYKGDEFVQRVNNANMTAEEFNKKFQEVGPPPVLYQTVKRSFVATDFSGQENKSLKIATNPKFTQDFTQNSSTESSPAENNFPASKVWIDPGCIVCDACETIYPEVFEVLDDTCVIRPDAPLHDGLRIAEAAEACPVEVIKFTKA